MRGRIRVACLAAWAASAVPAPAAAWDFPGHRIVGAIADLVLQQHYPATQQRVSELLVKNDRGTVERRSLSAAAVFPDCAKKGNVPFCGRPPSDEEKAYAERNPHHDKFHFTDVPDGDLSLQIDLPNLTVIGALKSGEPQGQPGR